MNNPKSFRLNKENTQLFEGNKETNSIIINRALLLYQLVAKEIGKPVLDGYLSNTGLMDLNISFSLKKDFIASSNNQSHNDLTTSQESEVVNGKDLEEPLPTNEISKANDLEKALLMQSSFHKEE